MTAARRRAELDFSLLFAGIFLSLGAHMAFAPLWLEDWGLDAGEIGRLNAFAILVRIVAGLALPIWADQLRRPATLMAALALAGAAAAALHLAAGDLASLYALAAALAIAWSGLIPLTDAHGFAAAERTGFSYRRARSVGSMAFLAATFLVGLAIERTGGALDLVFIWITTALALGAVGAWRAGAVINAQRPAEPPAPLTALRLLSRPRFALFFAGAAAISGSHAVYYIYGSLHWRALGYSETLIGALWAWGVLAEIALFWLGRSVMTRLGPLGAMALAGAAATVRWSAMALDPGLGALIALQTLHALTFALLHLATLAFIAAEAPEGARATAQGVMSAVAGGAAMALGAEIAGRLYPTLLGETYWLGTAFAAAGLAALLGLAALGRRSRLVS